VFVGDHGHAYARFRRALNTGNLTLARAAAAELGRPLALADALDVLALIAHHEPGRYSRAAARFAGRCAVEHPKVELAELSLLVAVLSAPDSELLRRVRDALP
jgi:hypothetical protein